MKPQRFRILDTDIVKFFEEYFMITQSKAFFKSQKIAKACSFIFKASDTYLVDKKSKGVGSRMRLAKTEVMWTENFVIFEEI